MLLKKPELDKNIWYPPIQELHVLPMKGKKSIRCILIFLEFWCSLPLPVCCLCAGYLFLPSKFSFILMVCLKLSVYLWHVLMFNEWESYPGVPQIQWGQKERIWCGRNVASALDMWYTCWTEDWWWLLVVVTSNWNCIMAFIVLGIMSDDTTWPLKL